MNKLLLSYATLALASLTACHPTPPTASGTIEVDEARVASRYGGRVEHVFAREGDALTNGQPLVELDAAELRAHRNQAAAQLAEAEAGPRREEISAVRAEWEAQTAQAEFARADAKRAEELFAMKTISTTERDAATMRANSLEKTAIAAKARLELLVAGTRPEQLAAARAQLAALDAQLREMQITALENSVLEVLQVRPGDVLAPNQAAATLLLTNHLWLRVFVPEPWLGRLRLGQKASVRVDAFPGKDFSGVIEQIARVAEFTPRNVQTTDERVKQVFGVKLRLDGSNADLRAGMAADVSFPD